MACFSNFFCVCLILLTLSKFSSLRGVTPLCLLLESGKTILMQCAHQVQSPDRYSTFCWLPYTFLRKYFLPELLPGMSAGNSPKAIMTSAFSCSNYNLKFFQMYFYWRRKISLLLCLWKWFKNATVVLFFVPAGNGYSLKSQFCSRLFLIPSHSDLT